VAADTRLSASLPSTDCCPSSDTESSASTRSGASPGRPSSRRRSPSLSPSAPPRVPRNCLLCRAPVSHTAAEGHRRGHPVPCPGGRGIPTVTPMLGGCRVRGEPLVQHPVGLQCPQRRVHQAIGVSSRAAREDEEGDREGGTPGHCWGPWGSDLHSAHSPTMRCPPQSRQT